MAAKLFTVATADTKLLFAETVLSASATVPEAPEPAMALVSIRVKPAPATTAPYALTCELPIITLESSSGRVAVVVAVFPVAAAVTELRLVVRVLSENTVPALVKVTSEDIANVAIPRLPWWLLATIAPPDCTAFSPSPDAAITPPQVGP